MKKPAEVVEQDPTEALAAGFEWLKNLDVSRPVSENHIPRLMALMREAGNKSQDVVPFFVALRLYKDRLEEHYKAVEALYRMTSEKIVPECFDREDTRNKTRKDGSRISVSSKLYAKILTDLAVAPNSDGEMEPILIRDPVMETYVNEEDRLAERQVVGNDGEPVWGEPYQPTFKQLAYAWLRSRGNGSLITETVNSSTLSSFARQLQEEENMTLPENMGFSTYETFTTSYTPAKKRS